MLIKILGLIIGILVLCAGLYYLIKEKVDPESKKNLRYCYCNRRCYRRRVRGIACVLKQG